jgi:group I intron endonuclease
MLIYLITNNVNGKQYVGQTVQTLPQRWSRHGYGAQPIARAIRKYGKVSFSIKELERCDSQEQLDERETYWARTLGTFSQKGYNLRTGKGRGVASPEVGRKISAANKGRKFSKTHRLNLRKSHLGIPLSSKRVADMRERMRGVPPSASVRLASSRKNAKTYILRNPQGETIEVLNLKRFCKKNNLHYPKMCEVASGKRSGHKGWKNNLNNLQTGASATARSTAWSASASASTWSRTRTASSTPPRSPT